MKDRVLRRVRPFNWLLSLLAFAALGAPGNAAGIASHTYACTDLQGLIAAHGFVFIASPDFGDFVVADSSYCSAGQLQPRSVATRDRAECPVNYCLPAPGSGSGGGGGGGGGM